MAAEPLIYGSATSLTERNCNGAVDCLGPANPNSLRVQTINAGGASTLASASLAGLSGGTATASVELGDIDLPQIHAGAWAGATNRLNTNTVAYQSYLYEGPDGNPFALLAELDFTSSASPLHVAASPCTLPSGCEYAGEASANLVIGMWDLSVLPTFDTSADILNFGFNAGCGQPGLLAVAAGGFASATGGAGGGSVSLSQGCDGAPITLAHGQQFLVFALLQTPANRLGFLDATHTLSVGLDESVLSVNQAAELRSGLVSASAAVPEPSSWALMILGLGAAGSVLRNRRQAAFAQR